MSQVIVTTPAELSAIIAEVIRREMAALALETARPKAIMNEKEAAAYVEQSPNTLRYWRSQGRGPAYQKSKRGIRYDRKDLDAWLASNRTLTSEAPHARQAD